MVQHEITRKRGRDRLDPTALRKGSLPSHAEPTTAQLAILCPPNEAQVAPALLQPDQQNLLHVQSWAGLRVAAEIGLVLLRVEVEAELGHLLYGENPVKAGPSTPALRGHFSQHSDHQFRDRCRTRAEKLL